MALVAVLSCCQTWGCKDESAATEASDKVSPRVASLVPAATDLMLGMGLGDHLVAVSNYCRVNPAATGFPTAGDYQTTDWERLAAVRPDVLLVFMAPERLPEGMTTRAGRLGMRIELFQTETIADVVAGMRRLGEITGESEKAEAAIAGLESRLSAVRERVRSRDRVPTLVAVGDQARGAIGAGGFLDELLTLAGGDNVAAGLAGRYPQLDREQRLALRPSHILHLLPGASAEQVAAAHRFWQAQPEGSPGSGVRVTVLSAWFLLQPGFHLPDTAEAFARALHGRDGVEGGGLP